MYYHCNACKSEQKFVRIRYRLSSVAVVDCTGVATNDPVPLNQEVLSTLDKLRCFNCLSVDVATIMPAKLIKEEN